jgi:hypothetical protein
MSKANPSPKDSCDCRSIAAMPIDIGIWHCNGKLNFGETEKQSSPGTQRWESPGAQKKIPY